LRPAPKLLALHCDLGLSELGLGGDRGVLADRHRERAGGQARQARQRDRLRLGLTAGNTGDQREVGDQAVHRAENRGTKPAAADLAVGMVRIVRLSSRVVAGTAGRDCHRLH
jgi:hypothetical protein